jgi:DNA-binding MarR family transcriptional regulator
MNSQTQYSTIYLRFLNLIQAIRELPTFPHVDPVEERLLNALAAIWHRGGRVTVLEAMSLPVDVSPTTLHRRLKSLRAKDLLALETDGNDTRIKYVVPTQRTQEYFSVLGRCLNEAGQVAG